MDECDNLVVITLATHEVAETEQQQQQQQPQPQQQQHKENVAIIDDNASELEEKQKHRDNSRSRATIEEDAAVDAEVEAVIMVKTVPHTRELHSL